MDAAPLRVGIAGLGVVGSATLTLLRERAENIALCARRPVEPIAVCARNRSRPLVLDGLDWHDSPTELAERTDLDVIVELIGGEDVAYAACQAALRSGKHVVTANKAMLARHGTALAGLAEQVGVNLRFEAAIAGAIPIVAAMRNSFTATRARSVSGILNGTCNYILSSMHATGREFAEVLAEAQALGFAEADPELDIDGWDAAHKIALLSALAFDRPVNFDSVSVEGIRYITQADIANATELGYRIRHLAIARETDIGIEQRVYPCLVDSASPLAAIEGAGNVVTIEGDGYGGCTFAGPGAGGAPTASAVIADLIALARTAGQGNPVFTVPVTALRTFSAADLSQISVPCYLRLAVHDRVGVLAEISAILRDAGVSIESLIQHRHEPSAPAPVVMITHPAPEAALDRVVAEIAALSSVVAPPHRIRIR